MKMSGINTAVLIWARERAGYTIEEVAHKLKRDAEEIVQWESGNSAPTYTQLEKLAYKIYKRPLAIFFFPSPPDEPDLKQSFRTLPDFEIDNLLPDTRYAVRQAEAMQLTLEELNDGVNPSDKKIFRDIELSTNQDASSAAARVRDHLGVHLDDQKKWKGVREALNAWRDIVEDNGIFIFKRSFKQKDISGLSVLDDEFPVIYLNNSTTASRQIFTIFHELSHLLLKTNGVTKEDDRYISALRGQNRDIEVFCNHFAAEFLVPTADFEGWLRRDLSVDQLVNILSDRYQVSCEVILRRLLDKGIVNQEYYEKQVKQWLDEYQERKVKSSGGGNYYNTQVTYLGDRYLNLAFGRYYQGRCTIEQLADYLNVKVKSIPGLEQSVFGKEAAQ
ncbi:MAG: ImmA/IrrE family metallo-endopeptidase [Actinobacteria bacterium]|nr:ImmA/IrrE family metallo-endopeptidase [Actinomycetota bacterium]